MVLAIETAMRLGELIEVEWENIDLKKRTAHLPDTKMCLPRDVPLSTRAIKVLRTRPRNIKSPKVFYEWNRNSHLGKAWRHAVKSAGIEGLRFHDLRHTFASRLVQRGIDLITIKDLLGHSSVRVTERYTHSNKTLKKAAVETLGRNSEKNDIKSGNLLPMCDMKKRTREDVSATSLYSIN